MSIFIYKHPVIGRAHLPFSTEMISLSSTDDCKQYRFKKSTEWNGERYILFQNADGKEVMQSAKSIRYVFTRLGEENINSKISNDQTIDLFDRGVAGESKEVLAKEFGLSVGTVRKIVSFRQRAGVTMNHINGVQK